LLNAACKPGSPNCNVTSLPYTSTTPGLSSNYLPLLVNGTHQYCPNLGSQGCSGSGSSDFEQSVRCCDGTAFDYQQCGTSARIAVWDPSLNVSGQNQPAQQGLQCLIHAPQQDILDPTNFAAGTGPLQISPGAFTQSRYGISGNSFIATSDSIVTVPLY